MGLGMCMYAYASMYACIYIYNICFVVGMYVSSFDKCLNVNFIKFPVSVCGNDFAGCLCVRRVV